MRDALSLERWYPATAEGMQEGNGVLFIRSWVEVPCHMLAPVGTCSTLHLLVSSQLVQETRGGCEQRWSEQSTDQNTKAEMYDYAADR